MIYRPDDLSLTYVRVFGPDGCGSYVSEHACLRWARDTIARLPEGWSGRVIYSPEAEEVEDEDEVRSAA